MNDQSEEPASHDQMLRYASIAAYKVLNDSLSGKLTIPATKQHYEAILEAVFFAARADNFDIGQSIHIAVKSCTFDAMQSAMKHYVAQAVPPHNVPIT